MANFDVGSSSGSGDAAPTDSSSSSLNSLQDEELGRQIKTSWCRRPRAWRTAITSPLTATLRRAPTPPLRNASNIQTAHRRDSVLNEHRRRDIRVGAPVPLAYRPAAEDELGYMEALCESAVVAEDDLKWLNDHSSDDDGGAGAEAAAARPRSITALPESISTPLPAGQMDGDGDGNGMCFPYDVLLHILRGLPCRALAESRRVCRAWRSIVDTHKLLLPHFFPRGSFPGIFTRNYGSNNESSFFAPPVPARSEHLLRGSHDGPVFQCPLFRHHKFSMLHYCNGLLLLEKDGNCYVCNPATIRCAELPPPMKEGRWWYHEFMFLAFDPAVSPHYEVFLLPRYSEEKIQPNKEVEQKEMHVHVRGVDEQDKVVSVLMISSQTNQWASREFVPGRCAPGPLYHMVTAPHPRHVRIWKSVEYWQGSLYVHCQNNIVMILRNLNGLYDMAQLPGKAYDDKEYLGLSELLDRSILASYDGGVRYVALDKFQLHVWRLTESAAGQIGWMLEHVADLTPYNHKVQQFMEPRVSWEAVESNKALLSLFEQCNLKEFVDDEEDDQSDTIDNSDSGTTDNSDRDTKDDEEGIHEADGFDGTTDDGDSHGSSDDACEHEDEDGDEDEDEEGEFKSEDGLKNSWDSDEDNFIDLDESVAHLGDKEYGRYRIIGLHPHKEVVLFLTYSGVVAYHLDTSRMQYLGWWLVRNTHSNFNGIGAAFPYRPCYVDALPTTKLPSSFCVSYHRW
ncbi:hypothetical protein VPH35_119168 [Triticum aestivum]